MVIRFTKATRFLCVCALLLLAALVSIGTRSITVSSPYPLRGRAMPLVIYRNLDDSGPTGVTLEALEKDLAWLGKNGYTALSEQELVAALRREAPLPASPVLLLFDDTAKSFPSETLPLLERAGLPWLSMEKYGLLSGELRAAGYPVVRIERVGVFGLGEQMQQ